MKTLDTIYNAYTKYGTPELEQKLCGRAKRLATIVLKQFKIYPYHQNFEDYLQTAYVVLWEVLPEYNPNVGRLEGFFMVSFKYKMINLIRGEREDVKYRSDIEVDSLSNDETVFDIYHLAEVKSTIDKYLDTGESRLLKFFQDNDLNIRTVNKTKHDESSAVLFEAIAEEFGTTAEDARYKFSSLHEKLNTIHSPSCSVMECGTKEVYTFVIEGESLRPICHRCYKEME